MESLKSLILSSMRPTVKRIYLITKDAINQIMGHPTQLVPSQDKIFIGAGNFSEIGAEYVKYFKDFCGLKPNHRVLDVGCGIGRMAVPLTRYINRSGRYDGFDIVQSGIDWCQQNLTARYPNFQFVLSDIYNKTYNQTGKIKASEYIFPYPDGVFDLVYLTSVFTHMFPEDVGHYLSEISRVLKPNGFCLITYFLLNQESQELIQSGKSVIDFKYKIDDFLTIDEKVPEEAICLQEEFVLGQYTKYKIAIVNPIRYGGWSGRKSLLTYQDVIIGKKLAN